MRSPQHPMTLTIHIYSAHFLPKPRGKEGDIESINPFVVITMHANEVKRGTTQVKDDGFAPCFDEKLTFEIHWPDVTLITFEVYHQVTRRPGGKPKFVAAAAFPVTGLRSGLRWVPLWDYRRNGIENCGLLVEVTKYPEEDDRRSRVESDISIMSQSVPVEDVPQELLQDGTYGSEHSLAQANHGARPGSFQEMSDLRVENERAVGTPGRRVGAWDPAKDLEFRDAIDVSSTLHAIQIQPPLLEDAEPQESSLAKCLSCGCGSRPKTPTVKDAQAAMSLLTL